MLLVLENKNKYKALIEKIERGELKNLKDLQKELRY
jgi:hypothetical protein